MVKKLKYVQQTQIHAESTPYTEWSKQKQDQKHFVIQNV